MQKTGFLITRLILFFPQQQNNGYECISHWLLNLFWSCINTVIFKAFYRLYLFIVLFLYKKNELAFSGFILDTSKILPTDFSSPLEMWPMGNKRYNSKEKDPTGLQLDPSINRRTVEFDNGTGILQVNTNSGFEVRN